MKIIACHAIHGDGSIDLYRVNLTPRVEEAIANINQEHGAMMEVIDNVPPHDQNRVADLTTKTDEEVAQTLAWWAAGCP